MTRIPSYIKWLRDKKNPTDYERAFTLYAMIGFARREFESLLVPILTMTKKETCECEPGIREIDGSPEEGFVCITCMKPIEAQEDEETIIQ